MKAFFDKAFCCGKTAVLETPEPVGVYSISKAETTESLEVSKQRERIRRHSALSYKSCTSSIGTFRSLSCSSLQSTMSKKTGNYDYYSVYSNNSRRASFASCGP